MGNDIPTLYDIHRNNILRSLETEEGCIELLIYSGFLLEKLKCDKCRSQMPIRFSAKHEGGYAYRCTDACRKAVSIRQVLSIQWPYSITLQAYVATIFVKFPEGITGSDLSSYLER